MKQHKKLARYLRGCSKALSLLAKEIEAAGEFDKESYDLLCKMSSEMLFNAVSYDYISRSAASLKVKE